MRKEGVLFLAVTATLLLVGANYYPLLNAFNLFIFAGVIPVLNLNIPDSFSLGFSLLSLTLLITWPFRDIIVEKLERKNKYIKQLRPKQRSSKTT